MHYEATIEIPAPIDVVWRIAQDPDLRAQWDQRVCDYHVQEPRQVGASLSMTIRLGLLRPRAQGIFLRWQPPHQSVVKIETTTSKLSPRGAGSWTFAATATGTRFTTRFTLMDQDLPKWMPKPLYRRLVEMDTRRSLHRLCRLLAQMTASTQ